MSTLTSTSRQALLQLSPLGDDDLRYRLEWHIQTAASRDPGPAGTARLQLEPQGLEAKFSYTEPHELLEVRVPYGEADDAPTAREILRQGSCRDADAALLDTLLGPGARDQLQQATQPVTELPDTGNDVATFGRIALMLEHLRRTCRPTDGLWAAELTWLLQHARLPEAFNGFVQATADAAVPALQLLDPTWLDRVSDTELRARLHQAVDSCSRASGIDDLGSLVTRLRQEALDELRDEISQLAPHATAPLDAPPVPAFTGTDTPGTDETDLGQIATIIDHTLQPYVTEALSQVIDGQLAVQIQPVDRLSSLDLLERVTIRVSAHSDKGTWLASTAESLRRTDHGLERRLPLPPDTNPEELTVVVGRHLPQRPLTGASATRRNAYYYTGRLVDARRVGRSDRDTAGHAQRAWQDLGQPDALEDLTATKASAPFLAELLPSTGVVDLAQLTELTDPAALSAARSIIWGTWPAHAARLEALRIEHGGDPAELGVHSLEQLALHAATQGDLVSARTLDEVAVSRW